MLIFRFPALGFDPDLGIFFVLVFSFGWLSSIVGIIYALYVSAARRMRDAIPFVVVNAIGLLLNIYGTLVAMGAYTRVL